MSDIYQVEKKLEFSERVLKSETTKMELQYENHRDCEQVV